MRSVTTLTISAGHRPLFRALPLVEVDRRDRDVRHLQLARHGGDGDGRGSGRGADEDIDLFFLDELARRARGGGGIGTVVELDERDLLAVDRAAVFMAGGDALGIRNADRGTVAAERGHEPDLDVGQRRLRGQDAGEKRRDG
jgi:hypothetical protein